MKRATNGPPATRNWHQNKVDDDDGVNDDEDGDDYFDINNLGFILEDQSFIYDNVTDDDDGNDSDDSDDDGYE